MNGIRFWLYNRFPCIRAVVSRTYDVSVLEDAVKHMSSREIESFKVWICRDGRIAFAFDNGILHYLRVKEE